MASEIWKVTSEKVGTLEPFKSEYDMEAFLMNNPVIIGCWKPEVGGKYPTLIRQQTQIIKKTKESGRIDLIGLKISINEKDYNNYYTLLIFELKKGDIDIPSVGQLQDYLEGWNNNDSAKANIKEWILSLATDRIEKAELEDAIDDKVLDKPTGVLVGYNFLPEAIKRASELKMNGIRLARFRAISTSDYFVIVEDQIGEIVNEAKRINLGWKDFINAGLIKQDDVLSLSKGEIEIIAKPDIESAYPKNLFFDKASISKLLANEKKIPKDSKKFWDIHINSVKEGKSIKITHATQLVYYAFGFPTSYWTPGGYWKLKRTGETLDTLKYRFKE